jgi:hypothetical protein
MAAKTMTPEEIWDKKNEFNIEKLLDPYREGGTPESPVTRTTGTIVDYLINKKKYPIDVAGAALLKVLLELHAGKVYNGDGSYGSKGRELVTHLRMTCDEFNTVLQKRKMYEWMAENVFKAVAQWAAEETKHQLKPWWKKMFSKKPPMKVKDVST